MFVDVLYLSGIRKGTNIYIYTSVAFLKKFVTNNCILNDRIVIASKLIEAGSEFKNK